MTGVFWIFAAIIVIAIVVIFISKKKCKYYKKDGKCVDKCDSKTYDFTTGSCVESCPAGTIEETTNTTNDLWKQCINVIDGNKCEAEGKTKIRITEKGIECVASCSDGDFNFINPDGLQSCLPKCSGYIHPITFKCVDSCGGDFPYTATDTDDNGVIIKFCSDKQE